MKLLFIFGAHAAGKMTVGQAISRITPEVAAEIIVRHFGYERTK